MREGIVIGSDNVFADIGHPRPAEALAKAQLAYRIATVIKQRGLTQAQAVFVKRKGNQCADRNGSHRDILVTSMDSSKLSKEGRDLAPARC